MAIDQVQTQIREHFDQAPYPNITIDSTPKNSPKALYFSNMVTAFYRRDQQVIDSKGKQILDVGCGSGYTSLGLAEANPGAQIVGIDISPISIEVAKQRFQYHGFTNGEFYVMGAEDLASLDRQFDYINCDETLYLLPDPLAGLQSMKSVLAERGMIRANLHSIRQRRHIFQAQELASFLGFFEDCEQMTAVESMRELFNSLDDSVFLKKMAWSKLPQTTPHMLANELLRGDKGFTILELFGMLEQSNLSFVDLTNRQWWDIRTLFPNQMPDFIQIALETGTEAQLLYLYELLNPVHRLIDFYCGHPDLPKSYTSPRGWSYDQWHQCGISAHPQLRTEELRNQLELSISQCLYFEASAYLHVSGPDALALRHRGCMVLHLLVSQPQSVTLKELREMWSQIYPLDLLTRQPRSIENYEQELLALVIGLEEMGYLLLDTRNF